MPRRARLSIPGIPWHIIQRGNNRSVCFQLKGPGSNSRPAGGRPANGNSATITLRSEAEQPQITGQTQIMGIPPELLIGSAESVQQKLGSAAAQIFAERQARAPAAIDWSAKTTSLFADDIKKKQKGKQPASWLSDFLGINKPAVNLADSTGLNVTTPIVEEAKQPFVERRQRSSVAPDGTKLLNDR